MGKWGNGSRNVGAMGERRDTSKEGGFWKWLSQGEMESEGPVEVWQSECLESTLNFGVYHSLV